MEPTSSPKPDMHGEEPQSAATYAQAQEGSRRAFAPSPLGLPTDDLANLTEQDLVSNPTAIRMTLHFFRETLEKNRTLENTLNTLQTYVKAYDVLMATAPKEQESIVTTYEARLAGMRLATETGGVLLGLSNIPIAFGGLIYSTNSRAGWFLFIVGVFMIIGGIIIQAFGRRMSAALSAVGRQLPGGKK